MRNRYRQRKRWKLFGCLAGTQNWSVVLFYAFLMIFLFFRPIFMEQNTKKPNRYVSLLNGYYFNLKSSKKKLRTEPNEKSDFHFPFASSLRCFTIINNNNNRAIIIWKLFNVNLIRVLISWNDWNPWI